MNLGIIGINIKPTCLADNEIFNNLHSYLSDSIDIRVGLGNNFFKYYYDRNPKMYDINNDEIVFSAPLNELIWVDYPMGYSQEARYIKFPSYGVAMDVSGSIKQKVKKLSYEDFITKETVQYPFEEFFFYLKINIGRSFTVKPNETLMFSEFMMNQLNLLFPNGYSSYEYRYTTERSNSLG